MAEDIRTTRTKNKIKNAFLTILKTHSYEQITVSDIAKEANINRVTFYTHYIDKACLLADLTEDMKKKFVSDAIGYAKTIDSKDEIFKYSIGLSTALLTMFERNKEIIVLLSEKENGVISKILEEQIGSFVTIILRQLDQYMPLKYPIKYIASFVTPAYISLILKYVTDPNPIPRNEFTKLLSELTENIVKNKIFTK